MRPRTRRKEDRVEHAIPIVLFAVILVVAIVVLTAISKRSAAGAKSRPPFAEGEQTPLWVTDEGSDA